MKYSGTSYPDLVHETASRIEIKDLESASRIEIKESDFISAINRFGRIFLYGTMEVMARKLISWSR